MLTGAILVVEDDLLVAEVVHGIVTSLGLAVVSAADGETAVELYQQRQSEICCIILDYELPGMHSSVALSRFRELNPKVKVILSTGYSASEIAGYFDLVDGYMPKPYGRSELLEQLTRIIS